MSSLLLVGGVALVVNSLDTKDPHVVFNIQLAFAVVHACLVLVGLFIRFRIYSESNVSVISVREDEDVPNLFGNKEDDSKAKMVDMTVVDYDIKHWTQMFFMRTLLPISIIAVVAYRWGIVVPLAIQCVHNPMQFYGYPLFKIHVLGKPAKGELARPWNNDGTPGFLKALTDRLNSARVQKRVVVVQPGTKVSRR